MVQSLKIEKVKETSERLNRSQGVVLVDYRGLTVQEINGLRAQLRENDGELKVVKNRLTKRALADAECEPLDGLLAGPIAIAFGYGEPSGPAKVCVKFSKTHDNLEIRGGLLEKKRVDVDKIMALSKLPGRTELLTQMAGTMMESARQVAAAMHQAVAKIAHAMKARSEQLES